MIADKAHLGLPLTDIFVFDVHGHMGKNNQMMYAETDADSIIKTMDRVGIDGICLSSMESFATDCRFGNEMVREAAEAHPGRIYGYLSATPYDAEYPFERYFATGSKMLGIKIHAVINHARIDDLRYFPYYEFANQRQLPVLIHTWDVPEIKQVEKLAEAYKDCPFIIAHSGMRSDEVRSEVVRVIKKCDNVFADTAMSISHDGAIEWLVSKVGADRVLYGSDLAFYDCRHTVGKLALSRLTEEEKIKIFGETARKLFSLN